MASLVVVFPAEPVTPIRGFPQICGQRGEGLESDQGVVDGQQLMSSGIAMKLIFAHDGCHCAASRPAPIKS